jgi:UDP-N-acetylmuramate dehydrogenase
MTLKNNYPLKNLNTFGVDAFAKYFAEVKSINDLSDIFQNRDISNNKVFVLGGGSNTLFVDNYEGLVIHNFFKGISIEEEDSETIVLKAGAGEIWNDVVKFCVKRNLGGIENMTFIPGSVGAAPIQNIGAYGQELKDTFYSLDAYEISTGLLKTFIKDDCRFAYRDSVFKNDLKNKFVITSIKLKLNKRPDLNLEYKGLKEELESSGIKHPGIREISYAVEKIRRSKLPLPSELGNAGSFFKNPVIEKDKFEKLKMKHNDLSGNVVNDGKIKISAGWLIERSGWKEKRTGDVGTFPKHALIIVNYGNAKGNDIYSFAKEIKNSVENEFGISLEFEVNCV